MPAQQAAVAGGGQGQQQPEKKSSAIFGILRMIAMWYMFKTFFGGGSQKKLTREEMFAPHFPKGTSLDMSVYLSESPHFRDFSGSKTHLARGGRPAGASSRKKAEHNLLPIAGKAIQLHSHSLVVPFTALECRDRQGY